MDRGRDGSSRGHGLWARMYPQTQVAPAAGKRAPIFLCPIVDDLFRGLSARPAGADEHDGRSGRAKHFGRDAAIHPAPHTGSAMR